MACSFFISELCFVFQYEKVDSLTPNNLLFVFDNRFNFLLRAFIKCIISQSEYIEIECGLFTNNH